MASRTHSTITTLSRDTKFRIPAKKSKSFTPMNRNTRFFRERRRRRVRFVSVLIRTLVVAVVLLIVGTIAVEVFKLEQVKLPNLSLPGLPDLPPITSEKSLPTEEKIQQLAEQVAELNRRNAMLQSELASHEGQMAHLADQAREFSEVNATLKADLMYFQRMVAEATKESGVVVRDVKANPTRKKGEWRYRLLLVQGGNPKSNFEGVIRVSLQGRSDDGTWLGPLKYEPDQQIPVKFRGYERIEKTITVADGQPQMRRMLVEVFKAGTSKPVVTQTVDIQ
jgi:hypothetical protein